MAESKIIYGTAVDVTLTAASLASDTNLLIGRESNAWDNTTDRWDDYLVSCYFTTGTTPTTARAIELWAYGYRDNTNLPSPFTGADSGRTLTAQQKQSVCRVLVASFATIATSDIRYETTMVSLASRFGMWLPPKGGFFLVHSTGVALNSTSGNHLVRIQPVRGEIV